MKKSRETVGNLYSVVKGAVRFVTLLCLFAVGLNGGAQSPHVATGITDPREVETFLGELQRASRSDDRHAIASLIQYPVTVLIDGLRVPFTDSAALLERYDAIFTSTLRETIARAVAPDRRQPGRDPMTVSPDGLVIGTDAILIKQDGDRLRIAGIVVPRGDPAVAEPSLARRSEPSTNVSRQKPRRVGIRIGPRPTQLSGALAAGASDMYMVWIPQGKILDVRLERVQNRMAVIRVQHAGTGAPLDVRAADGARVATGRAPESADYRIEVERTESGEPAPLPYVLALRLR